MLDNRPFIIIDKTTAQYTDEQIQAMLKDGTINEQTPVWARGMSSWVPLSEYMGKKDLFIKKAQSYSNQELLPPSLEQHPNQEYKQQAFTNTQVLPTKKLVSLYLWISAIYLLSDYSIRLYTLLFSPILDENRVLVNIMSLWIPYLGNIGNVILSIWTYQSYVNSRASGAIGMKFSPISAGILWNIPLLNLIFPFFFLQELWKTSINPTDWKNQKKSIAIVWILVFQLLAFSTTFLGTLLGTFFAGMLEIDQRMLTSYPYWNTALSLLSIVSGCTAFILIVCVIKRISDMQKRNSLFSQNPE